MSQLLIKIATNQNEINAALNIRAKAYEKKGYSSENRGRSITDRFDKKDKSILFIAYQEGEVVATNRIIIDSNNLLMLDDVGFSPALDELRKHGCLSEMGRMAFSPEHQTSRKDILKILNVPIQTIKDINKDIKFLVACGPNRQTRQYNRILKSSKVECQPVNVDLANNKILLYLSKLKL